MSSSADPLFRSHPRSFAENRYVYPVLSRRAGGISIGINLNLNRFCNFRCIYCQVEREGQRGKTAGEEKTPGTEIDLPRLADELNWTIEQFTSGNLFQAARFNRTPEALRRLNDIALSGDGESTACAEFVEAVTLCAATRKRHRLQNVKLVLITNASLLHRPKVREGLEILDRNNGEIWAKLDAGTEAHYAQVDRSAIPWRQILENLHTASRARPIVIQTLLMRIHGQPPSEEEISAYCRRLKEIIIGGGQIKLVQIHTIARRPAESYAAALSNAEVDAITDLIRRQTQLPVAAYYSES